MSHVTDQSPVSDADVPAWLERIGVPGLTDLHVHFMPDAVQQKVWGFFDRVPDTGRDPWTIEYRTSDEERVRTLRELGVRSFTTLNYAHRPGMARWLNDYSTAFAAAHDDAVHSATFYPEPDAADVVADALAAGARIWKVHVQVGGFSPVDPRLDDAWRLIAAAGTPVVIHCGDGPHWGEFTGVEPVRALVDRHPDLVLVIAHAGLPDYRSFVELAATGPNVYLDTTMVGTDYMQRIAPTPDDFPEMLAAMPGRVVLGTDFPSIPYPYAHQLQVLDHWRLGDEWLADVVWHTPRRLVGLS